jgi:hypothetical protein
VSAQQRWPGQLRGARLVVAALLLAGGTLKGATLYTDCGWGDNGYDGTTNVAVLGTNHGPKLNISAAIATADNGDVVRVAAGFYQETTWDTGVNSVTICPQGTVTIYDGDPWSTDSDGDGLPDAWEVKYSLDAFSTNGVNGATGDADTDGVSNLEEYQNGTNPQNADNTPPTISATITPTPNTAGWSTNDVVVHISASDAGSGLAAVLALDERGQSIGTPDGSGGVFVYFTSETNTEVIGLAIDLAGNHTAEVVPVNIDKTPPEITLDPGANQTNDLSNPLLVIEYNDTNGLASAGLNLDTLQITLDGEDVTTNPSTNSGLAFYRFEAGAIGNGSNLVAGTHTWSATIVDLAGHVTTVSNSFYATGAVNPDAPEITSLNLDGVTTLPEMSEIWVQGTVGDGSSTAMSSSPNFGMSPLGRIHVCTNIVVYMSVNGQPRELLNIHDFVFGEIIPVRPGTNVIVVAVVRENANCIPEMYSRMYFLDITNRFKTKLISPELGKFTNGETQKVVGVVSLVKDVFTYWATGLESISVNGIPATWSTNGAGTVDDTVTFSVDIPPPCTAVPLVATICWTFGGCDIVPLGLLEGYEISHRRAEHLEGSCQAVTAGDYCPGSDPWQTGGLWGQTIGKTTWTFDAPCNGMTNNDLAREDIGTSWQCFAGRPAWTDFLFTWDIDWWSQTNTVQQPARALSLGLRRNTDATVDSVVYGLNDDTGSLTFHAPFHYAKNTPVVLTFENLTYDVYTGEADWRQIKLKWGGTTYDPVGPGSYDVTVDGGKEYTVDESTFEWPVIATNFTSNGTTTGIYIHHLSFTGFHNQLCTCGPDVTKLVESILNQIQDTWDHEWNDYRKKCRACESLHDVWNVVVAGANWPMNTMAGHAWDISPLWSIGFDTYSYNDPPTTRGSPADGVHDVSVTFHDKCYLGGAVNYAQWGRMNKLCASLSSAHLVTFSLLASEATAWLWKIKQYGGNGADQAVAFTVYGYNGKDPKQFMTTGFLTNNEIPADKGRWQWEPNHDSHHYPVGWFVRGMCW